MSKIDSALSFLLKKSIDSAKVNKPFVDLESTIKILGVIFTVVTIILSYVTYRDSEKWKKAEFSVAQFRQFQNNKSVRIVNQLLDYDRRDVPLLKNDSLITIDETFVDRALMIDTITSSFDPKQIKLRDIFDEYFDELSLFNRYYKEKVVDSSVLKPYLLYQIKLIADPKHKRASKSLSILQKRIWKYLDYYEFTDVKELCKIFGYNIDPKLYPTIK